MSGYAERASDNRRRARRARVMAIIMWIVAGGFAVPAIWALTLGFIPQAIIILSSVLIIAASGVSSWISAASFERTALRWNRLEAMKGFWL